MASKGRKPGDTVEPPATPPPPRSGQEIIQSHHFCHEEVEEYTACFEHFKKSKENPEMFDKPMFRKVMKAIGWEITEEEMDKVFDEIKNKENGLVGKEEYLKLLNKCQKSTDDIKLELEEEFRFYDRDRSGYIDITELRRIFLARGKTYDRTYVEKRFAKADQDRNGKLSKEEFMQLMMTKS